MGKVPKEKNDHIITAAISMFVNNAKIQGLWEVDT